MKTFILALLILDRCRAAYLWHRRTFRPWLYDR